MLWTVHLNSNLLSHFPAYRKIWNEENIKSIHQIPAMYEISVILIDMKYSVQIGIWKFYPWWVGPWSFRFRVLFWHIPLFFLGSPFQARPRMRLTNIRLENSIPKQWSSRYDLENIVKYSSGPTYSFSWCDSHDLVCFIWLPCLWLFHDQKWLFFLLFGFFGFTIEYKFYISFQ